MRIDNAQHGVRRNRGVDGVATVAQNLRAGLTGLTMWSGDDPFGHLDRLSRSDELDGAWLDLEKRRQEPRLLSVEVDSNLRG